MMATLYIIIMYQGKLHSMLFIHNNYNVFVSRGVRGHS